MPPARTGDRALPRPEVALTGATGFIGRQLCRRLDQAGWRVRALVRPHSRNRHRLPPTAEACEVALDDRAGLHRALSGVAAAIHCAGSVRGATPDDFRPANIDAVATLAATCADLAEPPRVLLISSLAATRPALSDYAASKAAGERALASRTDLDWTILRPPAVYGPGDVELRPLFRAIRCGFAPRLGPRAQRLSLLHVADLAAAVLAWLDAAPACRQRTYTLDDGRPGGYDWPALVAAARGRLPVVTVPLPRALLEIAAQCNLWRVRWFGGAPPMLSPGKVRELSEPEWLCDNSALTAATGWVPRIDLAAGLRGLFQGE
jgi:2-alkyl-3-oxoalkanoate reductase